MQKDFQLNEGGFDKFYDATLEGVIKASNGKLVSKNMFDLNKVRGIEMEYTSISTPNLPGIFSVKTLYKN